MGIYINETALLCVSPRIPGDPYDYSRETVKVSVAMNGQDFADADSNAHVTFVGTGAEHIIMRWAITILLIGLLMVGLALFIAKICHDIKIPGGDLPKPVFTGTMQL